MEAYEGILGLLSGAISAGQGLSSEFDFNRRDYSASQAGRAGAAKSGSIGAGIGMGVGALLAPFTGGASIAAGGALGRSIGGLIGGQKAVERANSIISERQSRKDSFRSMYEDVAEQARISDLQDSSRAYIDNQYKLNIPSI